MVVVTVTVVSGAAVDLIRGGDDIVEVGTLLLWESVLGVLEESVLALGHSTRSLMFGRSCHTTKGSNGNVILPLGISSVMV